MLIGNEIKKKIEESTIQLRKENPIFKKTNIRQLNSVHIQNYIFNLWEALKYSPLHIKTAERVASSNNMKKEVVEYFRNKYVEEVGHDQWALEDMNKSSGVVPLKLMGSVNSLVQYLATISKNDVVAYGIYITVVEYFTVLITPYWLESLEKYHQIPKSNLSVFANHEEADRHHSEENFRTFDQTFGSYKKPEEFLDGVDEFFSFFNAFCNELYVYGNETVLKNENHEQRI